MKLYAEKIGNQLFPKEKDHFLSTGQQLRIYLTDEEEERNMVLFDEYIIDDEEHEDFGSKYVLLPIIGEDEMQDGIVIYERIFKY